MKRKEPTLVKIINSYAAKNAVVLINNFVPTIDNNVDTIDSREKVTPLIAAVGVGNPDILRAVLSHGPDLNKKANQGALHDAHESVTYHNGLAEHKFYPDKKSDIMRNLIAVENLIIEYKTLFEKGEPFNGII